MSEKRNNYNHIGVPKAYLKYMKYEIIEIKKPSVPLELPEDHPWHPKNKGKVKRIFLCSEGAYKTLKKWGWVK